MRTKAPVRYRLVGRARPSRMEAPVVVVDGVLTTGGLSILRGISVDEVDSLTILVPQDAVMRYGSLAGRGAVVLRTRVGPKQHEAGERAGICSTEDR